MVAMTLPAKPWVNGMMTADGTRMFDSSIGSEGAWRATPIPAGGLPAGSIIQWSSNTAPPNWFIADGSAISRTLWPSLFAVIGTTYGSGDGSTTFNLPDLRGRVAVGKNAGTFGTLGASGGSETHRHEYKFSLWDSNFSATASNAAMGNGVNNSGSAGAFRFSTGQWQGGVSQDGITQTRNPGATASSGTTTRMTSTGDTDLGSSLQPYLVTNYIIKATTGWSAGDSELALRMAAAETAAATTNRSGLVPIVPTSLSVGSGTATSNSTGKITFTNCTSIQANGVFNSNFTSYLQVCVFNTSSNLEVRQRLSASGTPLNLASYGWAGLAVSGGAASYYAGGGIDWYALATVQGSTSNSFTQEIHSPFESGRITRTVASGGFWDGAWKSVNFSGAFNDTRSLDGIQLYSTSAVQISGYMMFYGIR